jgi:hypothetical protein
MTGSETKESMKRRNDDIRPEYDLGTPSSKRRVTWKAQPRARPGCGADCLTLT